MRRVLRVKPRETLEKSPTPGLGPSPLTEGAKALLAGPDGPQLCLRDLVGWAFHLNSQTEGAVADVLSDFECLAIHRQASADGRVVTPVFAESLEDA